MIHAPVYKWCLFKIAPNIKLFTHTYWILQMKVANGKIVTKMDCLFIEILHIQLVFNIIWIVYYSKQKLTNANLYALTNISYTNKKGIQLSNNVQGNFDTRKNLIYFLYLNIEKGYCYSPKQFQPYMQYPDSILISNINLHAFQIIIWQCKPMMSFVNLCPSHIKPSQSASINLLVSIVRCS